MLFFTFLYRYAGNELPVRAASGKLPVRDQLSVGNQEAWKIPASQKRPGGKYLRA